MKQVDEIQEHDLEQLCAPLAEALAGSANRVAMAKAMNKILVRQIHEIDVAARLFSNEVNVEADVT